MRACGAAGVMLAAMLLAAAYPAGAAESPAGPEPDVVLDWAFLKRGPSGAPVRVEFAERVVIARGDLFKIYLEPVTRTTYVYLLLEDAGGGLELLFPERFETFTGRGYAGTPFTLPPGEDWFALDGTSGVERFHLVASSRRLQQLEASVTALGKADAAGLAAARRRVLDDLAALRRQNSKLTDVAEKPVAIGGSMRGSKTLEELATRIEAVTFYTRTFRLEH